MQSCQGITLGDQAGVAVLWIGCVCYVVGFSCPFWAHYFEFNIGVWLVCSQQECRSISTIYSLFKGDWWSAVQCLQCIGVVCVLGASCDAAVAVCIKPGWLSWRSFHHRHRHCLQACAVVGGVAGLLGDIIFSMNLEISNAPFMGILWAFPVNVTGCLLAVIASVIMAVGGCVERTGHRGPSESNREGLTERSSASYSSQAPFHIVIEDVTSPNFWAHDQISTRL